MRTLLLTLSLIIISPTLFSQNITIGEDGIVRCKDVAIGTTEVIFGETYEVVDRTILEQRRDEGADLSNVCTSNINDMNQLFFRKDFNQDIGNWDVSNVTDMSYMFYESSSFNQDIGNWDVSNVIDMHRMFTSSNKFNQDIGNWDVSSVTTMHEMFAMRNNKPGEFNQDISNWDVSSVTDMSVMFHDQESFNQDLRSWDVSNVTKIGSMFSGATSFNQDLSSWDVSNVTDMSGMFNGATSFNQPIGDWNVSKVTKMNDMFNEARGFNQNLSNWNVSSVVDMGNMFKRAVDFNQDIGNWDVSNVTDMSGMFDGAKSFNQPIGDWDVSKVTDMSGMFNEAYGFNENLSNWNVSSVVEMENMFRMAVNFNQDLSSWCVPNILVEPNNFSTASPLTEENKPVWGTCPGTPELITQLTPSNSSTDIDIRTPFTWETDSSSTHYQLQVFEGQSITLTDTLVDTTSFILPFSLKPNTTHYWKVRGINNDRGLTGEWSDIWSFTTQPIYVDDKETVRCKDIPIGTTGLINGETYEVVDRSLLEQRRDEGADLTKSCVSNVTDMSYLFRKLSFNQEIGGWDVSNVTNMSYMFSESDFNKDISIWDVSNVTNMKSMFDGSSFNQPIGIWDVSSVTDMSRLFKDTRFSSSPFNQEIGGWDVSSVTNMKSMFDGSSFNQSIGDWNVSNVTDMELMFHASTFDQPINNWDVSNVTIMEGMFSSSQFNQPLSDWDVSKVTDMLGMFFDSEFDYPIGSWDVSNVTDMSSMFTRSQFNKPLNDWDVSNVTDMNGMFDDSQFNQPLNDWNVSNVTNMRLMFIRSSFNQPIGQWDVFNVENMEAMFAFTPFNQDISDWCVIKLSDEPNAFSTDSPLSDENKPIWGSCPTYTPDKINLTSPYDGQYFFGLLNDNFYWVEDEKSTNYQLMIYEGYDEIGMEVLVDTLLPDTTYFTNESRFKYSTWYSVKVRGINSDKDLIGEWSDTSRFRTESLSDYEGFDGFVLISPKNGSIVNDIRSELIWANFTNVTGGLVDGYQIQVSTETYKWDSTSVVNEIVTDTSFTSPSLEYDTKYYWRIRAVADEEATNWTEVWDFTTMKSPLSSPSLSTPFNEQVNVGTLTEFTWNEVESSVSYHLQVSTDEGFSATVFDSSKVGSTSFTLTEPLNENTTYFWRMKSISDNELRNSEWSDTLTFTTGVRTSIEEELIPQEYVLSQNYPNPFNPSTQIQYALPEATEVSLEVFNSLGQKVMELVNGQQSAGYHIATFDASGLSSGVYLYKLTTPSFSQTNKMLLIK